MNVTSQVPLDNPQQVAQWLQSALPGYTYDVRGRFVVVGAGSATGVLIKPDGRGGASLIWAFPSMGVQILLTLSIVLTGILPGLILFGIVWLAVSGGVDRIKQDLARTLSSGAGAGAPIGGAGGFSAGPIRPSRPGGGLMAGGILTILVALGAFAGAASEFSDADRADRWANERPSYGSYGGYRSSYDPLGPGFWSSRARVHREQGAMAIGAGLFFMMLGIGMLVARSSKVKQFDMQYGNTGMQPMGMQGGYGQSAGFGQPGGFAQPGGYPSQPGGFGQPTSQPGFGQPGGFGQPTSQPGGFGQPTSQPGGFGQPGGYPPAEGSFSQQGGYPPPGSSPSQPGGYPSQPGGYPPAGGFGQPQGGYPPPAAAPPAGGFPPSGLPSQPGAPGPFSSPPSAPQQPGGWPPNNGGSQGGGGGWPQQ